MIINTTVKALKNLCAVLLGDGSTWEDIPGTTIPEGYYFRQNKSNRIWQWFRPALL